MDAASVSRPLLAAITGLVAAYSTCIFLMTIPLVQRHVFYLHKLPIWWRQRLDVPESFGFLSNQVIPLHVPTSDGETLYAWLMVPLALYLKNEQRFIGTNPSALVQDGSVLLQLLRREESRLVIYFHGNAGSVAQTRRIDAYKMILAPCENAFVLTFDYRGFAKASGSPSEAGLITDALSIIKWAVDMGKIPPDRIVLLSQSLGTAVATAAMQSFARDNMNTKFAGLILCGAFVDASSAMTFYRFCGIPLLAPLNLLRGLRFRVELFVSDTWDTKTRLAHIVSTNSCRAIVLITDVHDKVIPFEHTVELFDSVTLPTEKPHPSASRWTDVDGIALGHGGSIKEWRSGSFKIRQVLLNHGGHSGIMKGFAVTAEVLRLISPRDG